MHVLPALTAENCFSFFITHNCAFICKAYYWNLEIACLPVFICIAYTTNAQQRV